MISSILVLLAADPGGAVQNFMPEHRDISENYSTVVCPNEAAGHQLLNDFYRAKPRPRGNGRDLKLFFAGLEKTGCIQNGPKKEGGATIKKVVQRKTLKYRTWSETFILFQGVNAAGTEFAGILNESGNNGFPRTELMRWLGQWGDDGYIDARNALKNTTFIRTYRCPSSNSARQVVKVMQRAPKTGKGQQRALANSVKNQNCMPARDAYYITKKFENAEFDCGHECYDAWTALEGIDRSGITVGLVFNASHF